VCLCGNIAWPVGGKAGRRGVIFIGDYIYYPGYLCGVSMFCCHSVHSATYLDLNTRFGLATLTSASV